MLASSKGWECVCGTPESVRQALVAEDDAEKRSKFVERAPRGNGCMSAPRVSFYLFVFITAMNFVYIPVLVFYKYSRVPYLYQGVSNSVTFLAFGLGIQRCAYTNEDAVVLVSVATIVLLIGLVLAVSQADYLISALLQNPVAYQLTVVPAAGSTNVAQAAVTYAQVIYVLAYCVVSIIVATLNVGYLVFATGCVFTNVAVIDQVNSGTRTESRYKSYANDFISAFSDSRPNPVSKDDQEKMYRIVSVRRAMLIVVVCSMVNGVLALAEALVGWSYLGITNAGAYMSFDSFDAPVFYLFGCYFLFPFPTTDVPDSALKFFGQPIMFLLDLLYLAWGFAVFVYGAVEEPQVWGSNWLSYAGYVDIALHGYSTPSYSLIYPDAASNANSFGNASRSFAAILTVKCITVTVFVFAFALLFATLARRGSFVSAVRDQSPKLGKILCGR